MSNLWFVSCSHAIYANRLYLSLFKERHPTYLAINSSSSPQIIGAVRIHPSAEIDPSAVVGDQTSPRALLRYKINIPPSRSSLSPLPPPSHTSHPSPSLPLTPLPSLLPLPPPSSLSHLSPLSLPPSHSSLLPPPSHPSHSSLLPPPSSLLPLTPVTPLSSIDLTPFPCPPFSPSLPAGSQCVCGCWSGDWSRCTC